MKPSQERSRQPGNRENTNIKQASSAIEANTENKPHESPYEL